MEKVYIKVNDLNRWVAKYFENKDLITVENLIGCIEDLDSKIEDLEEKIEKLENKDEQDPFEYDDDVIY